MVKSQLEAGQCCLAAGCWTFSQRSTRILVRCGSSIDCCKTSCCTDMQQIFKAPWRQELLVILEWPESLKLTETPSLSLSLCQPNHAYTERFLNCCMIDRCRYAHFEAFPAWAGFCMYFVWNFANFHNCNICIRHTIDLCWNLLGSGQFCQKGGNSKNLEQDLWAAGISSQVLSRRVGRMFFFFFWQNWIIGDCKSQLEDPLMPILTVYLDDISHHSIVYSICTLYGWNLKGSNQAHMPLLS